MAVPLPRGPGTRAAHKKTVSALGNLSTSKHYFAENADESDVKVSRNFPPIFKLKLKKKNHRLCFRYGCCSDGVTPAQGFGQAGCPEYQTVVGITLLTDFMSQSQLTFLNNITAVYINLVMTFT